MIFIRINKTGSTSITKFIEGHADTLQLNKLDERVNRLGGWVSRERIKNTPSFTVVRNPFKRAISCYHHCLRLQEEERSSQAEPYTFGNWLELDFSQMLPKERAHSLRQVDYLYDHKNSISWVDYIFKLEQDNLGEMIAEVTGATGELPHEEHQAPDEWDWTPYHLELVREKYYMDFTTFGYDFQSVN